MSDLSELQNRADERAHEMLQNPRVLRTRADDLLIKAWRIYGGLGVNEAISMETSQAISALTMLAQAFTEKAEAIDWVKHTGQE